MKEKKGVTLIALVITIIIIMILASIAIYSGASTIRYVNFNKAKSEIQVIQSYVNQWYKEYQEAEDKNIFLGDYGELIETAIENDKCTQEQIDNAFAEGGITDDNKKSNYKFFSASFLKEKIGLDASFDYLISIKDRNTILYNGVLYNKKIYYTLDDFGLQNIKQTSNSEIVFNLEQGDNSDIIISDIAIMYKEIKRKEQENGEITTQEVERLNDISKFIVEYSKSGENIWNDITKDVKKFEDGEENNKTTKYKFSVDSFGEYEVRVRTTDKKLGDVKDITLEPRPGIKVGDYIKYTSPTETVSLSTAETGYSSTQTLPRKNTFRVMDIDELGNMTLMGAMTSDDQPISFQGALGYNNAVYTLNKKCSDLYKDESKGITARSIKVEDITDRLKTSGMNKLNYFIDKLIESKSVDNYIQSIDENSKRITFAKNGRYPDIYQYEKGGTIDGNLTSQEIGQSEHYAGYNGLTDKTTNPFSSITITQTYYTTYQGNQDHVATQQLNENDFVNIQNSSATYYNMFLETNTNYWMASRCVHCNPQGPDFRLRRIVKSDIRGFGLYYSGGDDSNYNSNRICPIVYLPTSVKIKRSLNATDENKPHEVQ